MQCRRHGHRPAIDTTRARLSAMMTAVTEDSRRWAMPGSAAEQDQGVPGGAPAPGMPAVPGMPAGEGAPGGVGPVGPAVAAGPDAVPRVALRPMTVADVLDGAFAIVKARPRKILGFTAAFVVPVSLLAAFLQRGALVGFWLSDDSALSSDTNTGGGEVVAAIVLLIVPSIALVCVAAAIAHLVSGWSVGRDAPGREMLGVVGRRWWPLLGTFVVVHLAEAVGVLACYIGALFVLPLFVPVAPIIGAEGASVGEALRRSVRMVRARYFPVMGLAVLMAVVSGLLGLALASLPQLVAVTLDSENAWPLLALGSIVSQVVTTPFVAAATVLLYLDLRVRTEGLDLELAAREVLDRAA
jgi:hypothetical protein